MWPKRSQPHEARTPARAPGILAIMGSSEDQATVANFAKSNGWAVAIVDTLDQTSKIAGKPEIAVIILDRDIVENDWQSTVRALAHRRPAPCVILASSVMDDYLFDEIVKQGGFDIVAKPIRADELRRIGNLAFTFWKSSVSAQSTE